MACDPPSQSIGHQNRHMHGLRSAWRIGTQSCYVQSVLEYRTACVAAEEP